MSKIVPAGPVLREWIVGKRVLIQLAQVARPHPHHLRGLGMEVVMRRVIRLDQIALLVCPVKAEVGKMCAGGVPVREVAGEGRFL